MVSWHGIKHVKSIYKRDLDILSSVVSGCGNRKPWRHIYPDSRMSEYKVVRERGKVAD